MRKKILVVALLFCMMLSLTACSEKSIQRKNDKIATVNIDGDKYVLNGDFQEVVGSMVTNGLPVMNQYSSNDVYDEEGKFEKSSLDRNECILSVERVAELNWKDGTLLYKEVIINGDKFEFKSGLGINSDSSKEDMKGLKGFINCAPLMKKGSDTYMAIYADGKYVDFAEYEDEYNTWVELVKEEGYEAGLRALLDERSDDFDANTGLGIYVSDVFSLKDIGEINEKMKTAEVPLKNEILYNLAINDIGKKMTDGEIDSYTILGYEFTKDDYIYMVYIEYFYEEEYDFKKFVK